MGRAGLQPGETGEPWLEVQPDGRWRARVRVRDRDGRVREVQALGDGKQAAKRALTRRLETRAVPGTRDLKPSSTVDELATYWLAQRAVDTEHPLRPQSLSGYTSTTSVLTGVLGGLRLIELTPGSVDAALTTLAKDGRDLAQVRAVLAQMLDVAVRHEAIPRNYLRGGRRETKRKGDVKALAVPEVHRLLRILVADLVRPDAAKARGGRPRNRDLLELVVLLLATGLRVSEALALRHRDVALSDDVPTVHVAATMVEPRKGFVEEHTRQDETKTRTERRILLHPHAVEVLLARRKATQWRRLDDPIFASSKGTYLWAANMRQRLARAVEGTEFEGLEFHTLRRTVGTLVAHEVGLDAARDLLGHSDGSVTFQHYVKAREVSPDVRHVIGAFFAEVDSDIHGISTGLAPEAGQK